MTESSVRELYAVADFCLIPMGTGNPSVGPEIAEVNIMFKLYAARESDLVGQCQRVLERSGLTYKVGGRSIANQIPPEI
ncbi:hypothetical protein CTheo_951 [Ceratobasidium theobromae]|uniref:Uncharacterized protein n=1 Tax=Ceratobasidium theobromae TaxID=1582974 RepID=A0A5N5QVX7_9AGAM|nr:hypothetical protein CTheo_951 [Ceratobasidium theobromae]